MSSVTYLRRDHRGYCRPGGSLFVRLAGILALRRQRRGLAALNPHLLRDIGVSPEEVSAELARPIWDVPAGWRQPGR